MMVLRNTILVSLLLACSGCVNVLGTFTGNILANQAIKQYDKYEKNKDKKNETR
jgi:hypothetical protein